MKIAQSVVELVVRMIHHIHLPLNMDFLRIVLGLEKEKVSDKIDIVTPFLTG